MLSRSILLLFIFTLTGQAGELPMELPKFFFPDEVVRVRELAEKGDPRAQAYLGTMYAEGCGVIVDEAQAYRWIRKAAEQGHLWSEFYLGIIFLGGTGTEVDLPEALKWFRKAAERGHAKAQHMLSLMYSSGQGTPQNPVEAAKWALKAAEQGHVRAQNEMGFYYAKGFGVTADREKSHYWFKKSAEQGDPTGQLHTGINYILGKNAKRDAVEAFKWIILAKAHGDKDARTMYNQAEAMLSPADRKEAKRRAEAFVPRPTPPVPLEKPPIEFAKGPRPKGSGSGFFITENGYLITNEHVAARDATVRIRIGDQELPARVVKTDHLNDLALLKAEGKFSPLAVVSSRDVKLGATVATIGFPNLLLQGVSPKLAKGVIASLAGIQDSPREFQTSVPIQPGNSGGPLVDERGNVVGVIVAQLSKRATLAATGTSAENVNYAIKSSLLLSFLESVPEITPLLKPPATADRKFEDVVLDTQNAAVLILVY
jgi:uncharacterized protein